MKLNARFEDILVKLLSTMKTILLLGNPGIGKSSFFLNIGKKLHTKVFILACNQLGDRSDLTGCRSIQGDDGNWRQIFFPHAVIMDAIQYALDNPRETPVLFFDEFNRTTSDITSAVLSMITERKIGTTDIPKNILFVLAGNDKGNITAIDKASISRFVKFNIEPDTSLFLSLFGNDLNVFIKQTLSAHPDAIYCERLITEGIKQSDDDDEESNSIEFLLDEDDGDFDQITTPRTIDALNSTLNSFTNQEMLEMMGEIVDDDGKNMLQVIIEGHTGETKFSAWLLETIANNVMTVNNTTSNVAATKPACYDALKNCTDMTSLNSFVSSMTDNEKSGCLVYALFEQADNNIIISALADATTGLDKDDVKTLMQLSTADMLDKENVNHFMSLSAPIATQLEIILGQSLS